MCQFSSCMTLDTLDRSHEVCMNNKARLLQSLAIPLLYIVVTPCCRSAESETLAHAAAATAAAVAAVVVVSG